MFISLTFAHYLLESAVAIIERKAEKNKAFFRTEAEKSVLGTWFRRDLPVL